jgi:2-dehydropantoate 2-reductase
MKIVVLGAGALGCALGTALTEAGHEVWLINRRQDHVDAMRAQGLRVLEAGQERSVPVRAASTCADVSPDTGPADLIIVLVKSFHTQDAIAGAGPVLGPNTLVLSLQNGLGHEDLLIEAFGAASVLAGKTYAGGVLLGPGHISMGLSGKETYIGELDGRLSTRVTALAQAFTQAGLLTHVSDNIMGTMWDKLLVNVATGALSGITGLSYGELYQMPEVKACALAAVGEAMAVARAKGIRLSVTDPEQPWIKAAVGLPPSFKASMLQSLEKGSITEVDFVNGAVVRWGEKLGVATPVNQTLVACLKGVERALALKLSQQGTAS